MTETLSGYRKATPGRQDRRLKPSKTLKGAKSALTPRVPWVRIPPLRSAYLSTVMPTWDCWPVALSRYVTLTMTPPKIGVTETVGGG